MARGIDVLLVATNDHHPSHPNTKDGRVQAGFLEVHQCGVLMVIAGLPFYFTWSGWRNVQ